jgi:hypothetical protein
MRVSIAKQLPLAALLGVSVLCANASAATDPAEAKISIPATSNGIWQAIDGHLAELHGVITSGKLESVHVHAYAVRDLVRALPTRSKDLSADALDKVKGESKFVDTLAERLDHTGDANDKAGTQANLQKLEGVLKLLRAQYPELK